MVLNGRLRTNDEDFRYSGHENNGKVVILKILFAGETILKL
jgi:hypothetical protein